LRSSLNREFTVLQSVDFNILCSWAILNELQKPPEAITNYLFLVELHSFAEY
jgi:hypothetical protein